MSYPFEFMPSAYNPRGYSQLSLWVKYTGPNQTNDVEVIHESPWCTHIKAPDREILVARNALRSASARPIDEGWDEFIPLSLTNCCAKDGVIKRIMVNPAGCVGKPANSPMHRHPNAPMNDGVITMSDSGGFQLSSGKEEWVNPHHLAEWYNDNADQGMLLDIPVFADDPELVMRATHLQKANNRAMVEKLRPGFGYAPVIHGLEEDTWKEVREILEEDEKAPILGLAGVYMSDMLFSMNRLLSILEDGHHYPHYHVLGVYNVAVLAPIIWVANRYKQQGRNILITSDASTPVYTASNRTMHLQRAHWRSPERMPLGQAAPLFKPNSDRFLPCSCHVCSTLKYVDIVANVSKCSVAHTFITHNMTEIVRWTNMMNEYAQTMSYSEYRELCSLQLKGGGSHDSSLMCLDFAEEFFQNGMSAARNKYKMYLSSMFSAAPTSYYDDASGIGETDSEPFFEDGYLDRIKRIFDRYEKWHETGDDGIVKGQPKTKGFRMLKKVASNSNASTKRRKGSGKPKKKKKASLTSSTSTHAKK